MVDAPRIPLHCPLEGRAFPPLRDPVGFTALNSSSVPRGYLALPHLSHYENPEGWIAPEPGSVLPQAGGLSWRPGCWARV